MALIGKRRSFLPPIVLLFHDNDHHENFQWRLAWNRFQSPKRGELCCEVWWVTAIEEWVHNNAAAKEGGVALGHPESSRPRKFSALEISDED